MDLWFIRPVRNAFDAGSPADTSRGHLYTPLNNGRRSNLKSTGNCNVHKGTLRYIIILLLTALYMQGGRKLKCWLTSLENVVDHICSLALKQDLRTRWLPKKYNIKIYKNSCTNHVKPTASCISDKCYVGTWAENSYLWTYDLYGSVRNILDACRSISWASERGLGPGNRDFLSPVKWYRAVIWVPFGAQKSLSLFGLINNALVYEL
jgi:hypothetical protein